MKRITTLVLLTALLAVCSVLPADAQSQDVYALLHGNALPLVDETGRTWVNSGVTVNSSGYFSGALSLAGNQELYTADDAVFNLADGRDFTVEFWMKLNSLPANQNKISMFSQGESVSSFMNFELFNNNANYALVFETANGGINIIAGYVSVATGTWNHYIVQRTSGIYSMYFNCVRVYNGAGQLQLKNYAAPVHVGRFLNGGHGVNGLMDEFRFLRSAPYSGATCTLPTSAYNLTPPTTSTVTPSPTATPTATLTPFPTITPVITVFECPAGQEARSSQVDAGTIHLWCQ